MTLRDLQGLLDFHYWARDRMFEALKSLTPEQFTQPSVGSFSSVRDTVVHTYSADWVWYSRWVGEAPTAMVDPTQFPDVASIAVAWDRLEEQARSLVSRLGESGIQRSIAYKTMDGHSQSQVFWQLAQHVVNHGSYHRGQVTTLLRQLGAPPPRSTDLITYYRERQGL
ncbi:MAG: DinB family protein [Vicinamibacterales bacterium]